MELTTCMLCDGARQGVDGKLYIFGGQWDRIQAASVPFAQPMMAIALVIQVEYSEALEEHEVVVSLRRQDGELAGVRVAGKLNVGHPPGLERGAPVSVPLVMELPGMSFDSFGKFEWLIEVDDQPLGRLPITITPGLQLPLMQPPPD